MKHVIWWSCRFSPYLASYPFWPKFLFLVLNLIFPWMTTSSLCLGYWFHLSLLTQFLLPCKYILYYYPYVIPCCRCTLFVYCFCLFHPQSWLLVHFWSVCLSFSPRSLHKYLSFNCGIQYFYWVNFSLWYSHIGGCWLFITNFIHSYNFNLFLIFLNWPILLLVECIVIIYFCVFLKIC